jgi:hypothetical protein
MDLISLEDVPVFQEKDGELNPEFVAQQEQIVEQKVSLLC